MDSEDNVSDGSYNISKQRDKAEGTKFCYFVDYDDSDDKSEDIRSTKNPSFKGSDLSLLSISKNEKFPAELQTALLEFVLAFVVENPSDIIDYAVQHFTALQNRRKQLAAAIPANLEQPSDVVVVGKKRKESLRRKSVFSEPYDPEQDTEEPFPYIEKTPEQLERLWSSIKNVVIFRSLGTEEKEQILNALFEKHVTQNQVVIQQGDDGDYFYVIESGKFKAVKNGYDVYFYNNAGIFGELALLYNTKRAASIIALTDGLLWALDRTTFRRILLSGAFKKRKLYQDLLQSVPMFSVLSNYERLKVADALNSRYYSKGDTIIKQGEIGDGMYFVESGRVAVYKDRGDDKGEKLVGKLMRGQYFGELALLTHEPRRATVKADTDVKTAFLEKDCFERLLGKCIDLLNRGIEDYNFKDDNLVQYYTESMLKMKLQQQAYLVRNENIADI